MILMQNATFAVSELQTMNLPSSSSLRRGGALFDALVSGEPSHMMATYYHPLYVGCRFKLPPHADRLEVEMIQTADLTLLCPSSFRRGGMVYEACCKAGRRSDWGPLTGGSFYFVWAIMPPSSTTTTSSESISNNVKVFALRKKIDGTQSYVYDQSAEELVRDDGESKIIGSGSSSSSSSSLEVSPSLSRSELRAKRLERFAGPPSPPLRLPVFHKEPNLRAELDHAHVAGAQELAQASSSSDHHDGHLSGQRSPQPPPPQPSGDSSAKLHSEELRDVLAVLAGATVVLEFPTCRQEGADNAIHFTWFFSPSASCDDAALLLEDTRSRALRINPVGLSEEGFYWCVERRRLSAGRKGKVNAAAEMKRKEEEEVVSRHAQVSLAPLDRFLLQCVEKATSLAENALSSLSRTPHSPQQQLASLEKAVRLISDVLTLSGSCDPTVGPTVGPTPTEVRVKVRCLAEQLPLEVSSMLTLRAQCHFAIAHLKPSARAATTGTPAPAPAAAPSAPPPPAPPAAAATAATSPGKTAESTRASSFEAARRDAKQALELVPGDRDALRAHALAAEHCDRAADALESLYMLRRLCGNRSTTASKNTSSNRGNASPAATKNAADASAESFPVQPIGDSFDYNARISALETRLQEERRAFREAKVQYRDKHPAQLPRWRSGSSQGSLDDDEEDEEDEARKDSEGFERKGRSSEHNDSWSSSWSSFWDRSRDGGGSGSCGGGGGSSDVGSGGDSSGAGRKKTRDGEGALFWRLEFSKQEEEWAAFAARVTAFPTAAAAAAATTASPLVLISSLLDVPWPSAALTGFRFVGLPETATRSEQRRAVKAMLLRWHPDKFAQRLAGAGATGLTVFTSKDVAAACAQRALAVSRRLTELNERI